MEYRTAAVYHATDTVLEPLNSVQNKLLRAVGCTDREALLYWNLAPLETRRDIAMLGVLHRTVLGKVPAHFERFFRLKAPRAAAHWTRLEERRHSRQLEERTYSNCPELLRRSAFGLIRVYNWLPEEVVATDCVHAFQAHLQDLVKQRAVENLEDWKLTLSPRVPWWKHALR